MPLQITGRHLTVTDQHREYIGKKVERLRKLVDHIDELGFTLSAEKLEHVVEINFRAGHLSAFTKCVNMDMMAAIDKAVDKSVSQISKAKEKRANKYKNGFQTIRRPPDLTAGVELEEEA